MVKELTKDIWNNYIVRPYNNSKKYELSVSKLQKIIEGHLGKDIKSVKKLDFKINKVYLTKGQCSEPFLIKEIINVIRDKKEIQYYCKGFYLNRQHLGMCGINADLLINQFI